MKVKYVTINEFDGRFLKKIELNQNFNIIAGPNGTGKSVFLQKIKQNQSLELFDGEPNQNIPQKIFALNPKRNSQRRSIEEIINQYRRDNRNYDHFLSEAINKQMNVGGFDNYPSFLELFLLYFEKLDNTGGNRIESMNKVILEFNTVISNIFEDYEITANWDDAKGRPIPKINKHGIEIPATSLSCGEDELFSLIVNLHSTREKFDVFLIDEPEVHLNWHLEEKLFTYLKNFSVKNNKQVIVATHSRIVFREEYKNCVQYFYWDNEKVNVSKTIPTFIKEKLIGEGINQLKLGNFSKMCFFVEDNSHEEYLLALSNVYNKDILVTKCGNSSNVKSLFNLSMNEGGWENSYFIIDNDNQGNTYPKENNFIQLSKYCIENYALSIEILSSVFQKDKAELVLKLFDIIVSCKEKILKNNKYLDFLFDKIEPTDITEERLTKFDASELFPKLLAYLNVSRYEFWKRIFIYCKANNCMVNVSEEKIINIIENA